MRGAATRGAERGRGHGLAAFAPLFAVVLGACAATAPQPSALPTTAPAEHLAVAPVRPAEPSPGAPAAASPAKPVDGKTDAKAIEDLRGLGRAELVSLLGEPDFLRRDAPAEVWQYRVPDCILDVFLYRDGGETRVVHAEARSRGLVLVTTSNCSASILTRRSPTAPL